MQVWASAAVAGLWATAMIFHVFTWFAIGVVMPPTYILLVMAIACLAINVWAVGHPSSMMQLIRVAVSAFRRGLEAASSKKAVRQRMQVTDVTDTI
ncbi:hypothetical protein [Microcoleus sp. bin38.metabat.b11b12b14.051]|uniref:hypothetical protein n=1 Tax=Microcoleus sp. bin38.metabat.b11b12b14.051 TaxID=2742709 RepID=UPI0025CF2E7F|nr:hypothetical protein [Microcoleus sp. bin38.metabat.b11b12b14.051]